MNFTIEGASGFQSSLADEAIRGVGESYPLTDFPVNVKLQFVDDPLPSFHNEAAGTTHDDGRNYTIRVANEIDDPDFLVEVIAHEIGHVVFMALDVNQNAAKAVFGADETAPWHASDTDGNWYAAIEEACAEEFKELYSPRKRYGNRTNWHIDEDGVDRFEALIFDVDSPDTVEPGWEEDLGPGTAFTFFSAAWEMSPPYNEGLGADPKPVFAYIRGQGWDVTSLLTQWYQTPRYYAAVVFDLVYEGQVLSDGSSPNIGDPYASVTTNAWSKAGVVPSRPGTQGGGQAPKWLFDPHTGQVIEGSTSAAANITRYPQVAEIHTSLVDLKGGASQRRDLGLLYESVYGSALPPPLIEDAPAPSPVTVTGAVMAAAHNTDSAAVLPSSGNLKAITERYKMRLRLVIGPLDVPGFHVGGPVASQPALGGDPSGWRGVGRQRPGRT